MIKQTVVYRNFLGEERTVENWFHITKSKVLTADDEVYQQIIRLGKELEAKAKVVDNVRDKVDETNPFDPNAMIIADAARSMARLLETVIDLSYGVLSEDGEQFIQSEEALQKFKYSAAYAAMIEQFMGNPDQLVQFVESILEV